MLHNFSTKAHWELELELIDESSSKLSRHEVTV
jgi:hypothetical protein